MDSAITFKDVSYWYPKSSLPALSNLSIDVGESEFLLVVGASGSGKSTFLRCVNGLVPHFSGGKFSGSVKVLGFDTVETPTRNIAGYVGFVFQDPESQFVMSSVESEIAFGLENRRLQRREIRRGIDEVLGFFNIQGLAERHVSTLSSGEKQKVVLASAVALKPRVLVLDEPTSQLDPAGAHDFLFLLRKLNRELGLTVVLAEHRVGRVAGFVDRVLDLDRGLAGSPEDILPNCRHRPPTIQLAEKLKTKNIDIGVPLSAGEARKKLRKYKKSFKRKKAVKEKPGKKAVATIKNLCKSLNGKRVLENVNLTLYENEFTAVIGPNGAGKTTLVKHLNGLLKPDLGEVIVNGIDTRGKSVEEMARTVGFVSQNPNDYLFSETVREELRFTAKNLGTSPDINGILKQVGLLEHENSYPRDLSGGERQKTALASVLAGEPEIIVLDEPTRGMDAESKRQLVGILNGLKSSGKTIVFVTHDVETAAYAADRVVVIEGGGVVSDGPTYIILAKHPVFRPQVSEVFPGKNYLTVEDAVEGMN